MKLIKTCILIMLLLFVASCDEKNKKTGYWVEYRDVIPDSLREQAFEAKYRMLSALPMSSDEDTRQVLMEVDYQVKQMYASNVLCLFRISYSGNMSYRDMIVPDRMTAEEKRIFQNLERAFHKRDKNE